MASSLLHQAPGTFHQEHRAWAFNVDFYSVGIPLLLVIGPWVIVRALFRTNRSRRMGFRRRDTGLLVLAGIAWFMAIQVPNIPLWEETQSTTMHLVGGGVIAPALYAYFCRAYCLPAAPLWWQRLALLFGFTSALGVLNELMELALAEMGLLRIDGTDVWYDLAASTLGVGVAFIAQEVLRRRRAHRITVPPKPATSIR